MTLKDQSQRCKQYCVEEAAYISYRVSVSANAAA